MEVYILLERYKQSNYTEPNYFASAEDSGEILGVYLKKEKADDEKARLEEILEQEMDEDADNDVYYVVETHSVR